jgi:hypothetical protein
MAEKKLEARGELGVPELWDSRSPGGMRAASTRGDSWVRVPSGQFVYSSVQWRRHGELLNERTYPFGH